MKKRFKTKLVLKKKTISNLEDDEMNLIRGATLYLPCTDSCSLYMGCCPPTKEEQLYKEEKYQG